MRCDESPHGFRAGAATPRSRESRGTNSGVAGKQRYKLQGHGKAEIQTPMFRKSGVGVPVPEFTVFCHV
ncbi:hypothetical protein PAXRUDRAFT_836357, partial [Paxillus rubicundulus Ve08.2h10]